MRFGITRLVLGSSAFIGISEDEFLHAKISKRNLARIVSIEEKLASVIV